MNDIDIINSIICKLKDEEIWFTQKTDPTWNNPSHYYKLDEYGDLTDTAKKEIIKEVNSYIGDGAVDIEDAIDIWEQEALVDNRIAYREMLVTKFKDKPIVDGIEAYTSGVLKEKYNRKVENSEYVSKFDELDNLLNTYAVSETDKVSLYNYFNDNKISDLNGNNDELYDNWLYDMRENHFKDLIEYLKELDDETDTYIDRIKENKEIKLESTEIDAVKWLYGLNTSEAKEYIKSNPDKVKSIVNGYLNNAKKNFYEGESQVLKANKKMFNLNEASEYVSKYDELDNLLSVYAADDKDKIDLYNYFNANKIDNLENDNEEKYDDWLDEMRESSFNKLFNYLKEKDDDTAYLIDKLKENKLRKNENYKRRLKEENNKSANLISDMFKSPDFDADSKSGQIVMRTSELFNALSDKGYDVQVSFDNGESTNAILLGQQGGQVLITITDTNQPLRAFTSGNFELNDDNMKILDDIKEQISVL